ncbi:3'-5'-exoribonuclease [Polyrhizophydium stewartii]|uniref:3'-5'-exoribonuclease n=1 Tax=Polyrhizophydium stewartii TaxID=2732419 RepID=A0ABR4N9E5_9FUNG
MVRETEPSNNEREFVSKAVAEGLRVDGRAHNSVRSIKIVLGPELGYAQVQLGKTRVMASVSCEIVRPSAGNPTDGVLHFNTEFSPMASPAFEFDRISEEEVMVSRMLEKALRRARAVDTEGLCIVAGEKVWAIRVDTRVLDHEGNLLDCACMAAMCALLHFRRPDVTVIGEDVTIHTAEEKNPIALSVHHIPVCVTFACFNDGEHQVVDPLLLEEQVMDGSMTFVVNIHRELCTLSKAGGTPVSPDQVMLCASIAAVKSAEITQLIRQAVAEDAKKRQTDKK